MAPSLREVGKTEPYFRKRLRAGSCWGTSRDGGGGGNGCRRSQTAEHRPDRRSAAFMVADDYTATDLEQSTGLKTMPIGAGEGGGFTRPFSRPEPGGPKADF